MANLLIKPTTGSGNKVIIQDQAGGDILTSADSGATIENATFPTIKLTPGTAPSSPVEGQMYYNDVDNIVYIYNGTAWDQLSNQILDGSTAALAPAYGSDIMALGKPTGLYWLTGAINSQLSAQQVYVDSSGWMLYYRHAGTGGTQNSTYDVNGDSLGEGAVGTLYSPTQGLTDTGSSTTAGSRGVARLATNFVRALGGDSSTGNTYRFTIGGTTVYITDAQWWATATTSDSYGVTSISWGTSYAGRRDNTGTPEAARPMGTYPLGSYTIPYYHGAGYSGGYDGTSWRVASTLWVREY